MSLQKNANNEKKHNKLIALYKSSEQFNITESLIVIKLTILILTAK